MTEVQIALTGRIDSAKAGEWEEKITGIVNAAPEDRKIIFDAEQLEYISSAGLRVLLKTARSEKRKPAVINASREILDIFEVTGFTTILETAPSLRSMEVAGLPVISEEGTEKVCRLPDGAEIRVFGTETTYDEVKEMSEEYMEENPGAFPAEIVRTEEGFGLVLHV